MYQIITDGSCDLGQELAEKLGVEVVPFYVSVDETVYKKEIKEVGVREFYEYMIANPKVFPKSSLPSVEDYIQIFKKYVSQGIDVICICITTKFSGSYNSALNAKQIIEEEYPEARIKVVDSTVNTVLQGTLVMELVKCQRSGASFEELLDTIEKIKSTGRIFFTVDSVDYLTKGGRIGKLAKIATGTLNIKPLIVLKEGEIFPSGITRGRASAKKKVINQTIKYISENGNDPDRFAVNVGYGYDKEEGEEFRQAFIGKLKEKWPDTKTEVGILQIGATIGVHTGPYPLGFGIIKKAD
ncbi:MAG: DegV family protein [Clostridia bacterium]|nr:DegV family protein [Clostridia bacterium]NCC45034.1 DegV family protein [Clostridia bacterium]